MMSFMPVGSPGPMELLIIFSIVLVLFGAKKLPTIARSFGSSLSAFKKGKLEAEKELKEIENSIKEATAE